MPETLGFGESPIDPRLIVVLLRGTELLHDQLSDALRIRDNRTLESEVRSLGRDLQSVDGMDRAAASRSDAVRSEAQVYVSRQRQDLW